MKYFYTVLVSILITFNLHSQVVINEYSASNRSNHQDNFGEYEDWVELHNAGAAAVNIGGYYLTDNTNDLLKYQIPAGLTIPAGGFRIFYCSDKNIVAGGAYHTNFILTQSNYSDMVILSNSGGVIIDSISLMPARRNHSRGRATNGSNLWRVFETPTPNASNNTQTPRIEYVPKVQTSLVAGFYTGTQSLTLSCPQANTSIYYTTNGSIPTNTASATNFLYSGPISLSVNTPIRARAFDNANQYSGSFTITNSYFINEPIPTYPTWNFVSNNMTNFFNSGTETMISIEHFGTDGTRLFQFEGDVRRHGNDSWAYSQKGMRFYVRDQYGYLNKVDNQIFPTSPRSDFDVLLVKAAGSDNFPDGGSNPPTRCAHIRDAYVQTLAEKFDLNVDVRRYKPAQSYVNAQYWGIYETRERVDVDYTNYYYGAEEKWVDMLEYWGGLQIVSGSDTGWINIFNFIVNNNMANQANYNYAISKFDPMSLIDYFILNTYTVNSDWLNWNTAWWRSREPGNEVRWRYKLWDQDNTFNLGQNYTGLPTTGNTADPCDVENLPQYSNTNNPNEGHVRIFNSLMNNPAFEQMYINRYADLINTAFYCPSMLNHFDTMIARLAPQMQRHTTRWGGSVAQWNTAVQYTRNQIAGRCNSVQVGLGPCYNVTGPYNVTVNVTPSCAGTIKLNSITPDVYPFTGSYYGGINITLEANAVPGYQFSHWQFTNGHVPTPNTNTDSVWLDLGTTGDSVIAVFVPTTPVNGQLTVQIVGTNPGTVVVNGSTVSNGQVVSIPFGSSVTVSATPQSGCSFFKWELNNTIVRPNDTLETGTFCFRKNDTLVARFDNCIITVPDTFDLTVLVQPVPGVGSVTINGIPVPSTPIVLPIPGNTLLNISALANAGYTFSNWQLFHHSINPNNNSINGSFTITADDTLIAVFTQNPDTFDLTVLVQTSNASGSVNINGTAVGVTPVTISYVSGTNLNLNAISNVGFSFSNWVISNHIINPSVNNSSASFTINQDDTLIAVFTQNPDTFDLTIIVNPNNTAGSVSLNGIAVGATPIVRRFVDGTLINCLATNNVGFAFVNWQIFHHSLSPGTTNPSASFTISQHDTLIANFIDLPDTFALTVDVQPPGAGNVTINGLGFSSYPSSRTYVENSLLNISNTATAGYQFAYWSLPSHTLNPNNTTVNASFSITQSDALVANYTLIPPDSFDITFIVQPDSACDIAINGFSPGDGNYPYVIRFEEGAMVDLIPSSDTFYLFDRWIVPNHVEVPNATTEEIYFTVALNDTVTLVCKIDYDTILAPEPPVVLQPGVVIPSGFTPNGDGVNDVFRLKGEPLFNYDMKIYNRWGEKVFESNNYSRGWDGSYKGKPSAMGSYTYYFEGRTAKGLPVKGKGTITLLR